MKCHNMMCHPLQGPVFIRIVPRERVIPRMGHRVFKLNSSTIIKIMEMNQTKVVGNKEFGFESLYLCC